jgi:hypothetical protein
MSIGTALRGESQEHAEGAPQGTEAICRHGVFYLSTSYFTISMRRVCVKEPACS